MTSTPFVSTQWLADHLDDANVTIIDASWYLPTQNRNGRTEYEAGHIPGAVFFDIDEISDKTSSLPHMLPDAALFAQHMARLGISDQPHLIVYDGAGLFSAPRVRWTLQVFGATNVSILAGGAPKWRSENRPWTNAATTPKPATFTPTFNAASVATLATVKSTLKTGSAQIVDARPADRFRGDAPEPRPGLKSGHMPGSFNVPFGAIIADGQLKSPAEIRSAFASAGVNLDAPVITSCGSGVSAAILALALETADKPIEALYDGAWAEWASQPDALIETSR
ncbi:MAG: thiosulfate sulfurtransferase [Pseudomonadota bacterium]